MFVAENSAAEDLAI